MMTIKKNNLLNQKTLAEKIVFGIMFVVFLIWAISFLYAIIWLLANSLKTYNNYNDDIAKGLAFPKAGGWKFENYMQAFEKLEYNDTKLFGMFFNSLWTCVVSIGVNMFFSACTGYVLSKYKFKGRNFIYGTAIVCMTLPIFGTGGATYTFYYITGMYDTPMYIIFSALGSFSVRFLMLYSFFKSISWEYAEAVFLDGGNDFTVFFKIMIPVAFPMIMTLFITGFIAQWNSYESLLLYMPSYPTLAVGIYKLSTKFKRDGMLTTYFASMIISMIPVIAIFIAFSDVIMKNFSIGGLKG